MIFLLVLLLIISLVTLKKHVLLGLFSLFSVIFFTIYKDTYYLYLNVTVPLLCLVLPEITQRIQENFSLNRFLVPTIIGSIICYNVISYFSGYASLQKLPLGDITQTLNSQHTSVLYGVNGITPALAYTTNKQLLVGIVDTNDNIFRKGYLNATKLTTDAIHAHAIVVTQGVWYPDQGIEQDVMTEIVDTDLLKKNCHILKRFPFQSEGIINSINLFSC